MNLCEICRWFGTAPFCAGQYEGYWIHSDLNWSSYYSGHGGYLVAEPAGNAFLSGSKSGVVNIATVL